MQKYVGDRCGGGYYSFLCPSLPINLDRLCERPLTQMLLSQRHFLPLSSANFFFHPIQPSAFSHSLRFPSLPTTRCCRCSAQKSWIAEISEEFTADAVPGASTAEEGPIELSPSSSTIFATSDGPTPLQTATSLLLTGAITALLFRSLRRRANRAKETKFRSSGEKKTLTEEAMESLKSVALSPATPKEPSPVSTFLGALAAGAIALILYKFATTVESSLNRQTMPDNYSVRQITVTIRTIINGLCYLATFVFAANSLGLLLYSGQLAINSYLGGSSSETEAPSSSSEASSTGSPETTGAIEDQSSENT